MSHFLLIVAVIGVLYVANVVNNRLVDKSYLLICFIATAVLILIARLDGLTWTDLGLGHSTWVQGLIWSAWVALAVLAFYAIAASIPATRKGFGDKRAAEQSLINLCYESMIRIPLGTALLEEVAFRAVLLAVVWAEWGQWWGVIVSSVLFGFWHVFPSLEFHENNESAQLLGEGRSAQVRSVVLTVLFTGAAGVGFCMLRIWSDSLFPPFVLHAFLNGIGVAVTWAFARSLREL
ncbi:MAG: CPBP family intramembrane glutamic endopeptidase [Actinomycetes bacterium]